MLRMVVAAAVCTAMLPVPGARAEYPEKNIDFVIPFGPGGGFDRTVRMIAPFLEKYLPNKVEVLPKNVIGAGGRRGVATVFRAKPDGYTIGIANMPGAAMPAVLGEPTEYDLDKLVFIARVGSEEYMMGVAAKSPYKTLDDLKKLGRPVKFLHTDFGSTAFAATAIAMEVMKLPGQHLTGYKGTSEFILAAVRGDGDAAIAPVSTMRSFLQSGDVHGVFTFEEKSSVEGVPTVASLGYPELTGLSVDRFVIAPPGLPAAVKKTLSDALMKALADPQLKELAEKAGEPFSGLPAEEAKASADRSLALYLKHKSAIAEAQQKK